MSDKRIFWADDEYANTHGELKVRGLTAEMKRRGIAATVTLAPNAADALAEIVGHVQVPDVIVMDLQFNPPRAKKPDRRGEEVIEKLLSAAPGIPVIIYAASVQTGSREFARLPNVHAVIAKEDQRLFMDVLAKLLGVRLPTIVHLSDIHFGAQHGHGGAMSYEALRATFDPEVGFFLGPRRPNILVVSGDFTTGAAHDEFREALEFLKWLTTALDLEPDNVCFVPGNHDVELSDPYSYQNYWNDLVVAFYGDDAKARGGFLQPPPRHTRVAPINLVWLRTPPGVDAVLVGLSTTTTLRATKTARFPLETQAEIATDQLTALRGALSQPAGTRAVRVAVLHHHLFPVASRRPLDGNTSDDDSVVYGQPMLLDWLAENGFQLVLHGHTHYPSFRSIQTHFAGNSQVKREAIHIAAAGTLGASTLQKAAPYHHYYLISAATAIDGELSLKVESRILGHDRASWQSEAGLSGSVTLLPHKP
ncbi:MAG: metallophosphoesterase [Acidobacteria bacterium]|nr:metallophosphoesterase [Acidobacteriota bacterium]